jgi:hypothetical protein
MVKRVKNSLVRKPVEITSAEPQLSGHDSASMQLLTTTSIPKISQRQSERPFPTCDGPAVALLLYKFIDAFRDMPALDSDPNANHRCCETCRLKALRAFKILEEILFHVREISRKLNLITTAMLMLRQARSVTSHRTNTVWSESIRLYLSKALQIRISLVSMFTTLLSTSLFTSALCMLDSGSRSLN